MSARLPVFSCRQRALFWITATLIVDAQAQGDWR